MIEGEISLNNFLTVVLTYVRAISVAVASSVSAQRNSSPVHGPIHKAYVTCNYHGDLYCWHNVAMEVKCTWRCIRFVKRDTIESMSSDPQAVRDEECDNVRRVVSIFQALPAFFPA